MLQSLLAIPQSPFELSILHGLQNCLENWPRLKPHGQKIIASDEPDWAHLFGRGFSQKPLDEIPIPQHFVTREAIAVKLQKHWTSENARCTPKLQEHKLSLGTAGPDKKTPLARLANKRTFALVSSAKACGL